MKAEDLKSVLRFSDRNQTYHDVLRGVGVGAYTCINDIDDAIDDAIDYDIDDADDDVNIRKVVTFLAKFKSPILNYSKNRFASSLEISRTMDLIISDLVQLCRDIGVRAPRIFKSDERFHNRISLSINNLFSHSQ